MSGVFQIAVDGPSGAGKSTVARLVASRLGIEYIDTGAMYRAAALKMTRAGVGADAPEERLAALLADTLIDFSDGRVRLDGDDVSGWIRTEEISMLASACSARGIVRDKLVALQRRMGEQQSVVMDGRDIGSNVFPNAAYKFFLNASDVERARRRFAELAARDGDAAVDFDRVLREIRERDHNDTRRSLNPLIKTDDAIEIDSTHMTAEDVAVFILDRVAGR